MKESILRTLDPVVNLSPLCWLQHWSFAVLLQPLKFLLDYCSGLFSLLHLESSSVKSVFEMRSM